MQGWLEHRMIAAAFILMKRRRSKEYNEVLKVLLKEGIILHLVLNPTVSKTCRVQILICKIFQLIKLSKS
jgi:hypothetical protein